MRKTAIGVLLAVLAGGGARAHATVLTVGPSGEYDTIQEALTAAAAIPFVPPHPSHEIRVQRGTYLENLRTPNPCCGGRAIRVSGGWSSTFASRQLDPALTVVDGRGLGRVFSAPSVTSGALTLDNLTLRNGLVRAGGSHGIGMGAGIRAVVTGLAQLILTRVHVRSNTIRAEAAGAEAQGAGAFVLLQDSAAFLASDSRFLLNSTSPAGFSLASFGGGLHLQVFGGAANIWRSEFVGNSAYGSVSSYGGGLYALVQRGGGAGLGMEDSYLQGNIVSSAIGQGTGAAINAIDGDGATTVRLQRCRFVSNIVGQSQLHASASQGTRIDVSDTLIADGRAGLRVFVNQAAARFTNLTVARNQLRGIQGSASGGLLSVHNTIAFGNLGGDLSLGGSTVTTGFNLVGIDPLFRDPEAGSYELDGASEAIDAGTNAPPAGLGIVDLARRDRVFNGTVDIGAYEFYPD